MAFNGRLLVLLLVTISHKALCQVPFPELCPQVKVVEEFDLDKYMGIWYEYAKYPFLWEAGQKCQYAIYTNNGNDTVSVKNVGTYAIVDKTHSVQGTAKVIAPGQLAVAFRNQVVNDPNYLILGTDYDNWVVVYSCRNVSSFAHTKIVWILTRSRQPSEEAINSAKQVLKDNHLTEQFLMTSKQTDCPEMTDTNGDDQEVASSNQSQIGLSSPNSSSNLLQVA
ncbi:apolipoprotein D-like [Haematobia irritans]|uniref:apolipoprotein D-like n=1 Tax=Haematobia irritans TaxID=7368 RepID=UPI003F4FE8CF